MTDTVRLGRITLALNTVVGFVAVVLLVWALVDVRAEARRADGRAAEELKARQAEQLLEEEENERLLRELGRRSARHDRLLLGLARRHGIPTEGLTPQPADGEAPPKKPPSKKPPKKPPTKPPPDPPITPDPIVCAPIVGCVERRAP